MKTPIKTVCVTGCLGFMGSHFTRACLKKGWRVWGIDKKTYASDPARLVEFNKYPTFEFHYGDIATLEHLYDVDFIFNFAAETHVDNSIVDSRRFLHSNILGVQNLLELIRAKRHYGMPVLVQLSTDEVYGDITNGRHTVDSPLHPSNPYSASKASADMLITAWHRTHDVPYVIVRPTNNYGIGQYPEKLIPKAVKYLTLGKKIPLHGDGSFVRNWLHVDDTVDGILTIVEKGGLNRIYNIAGNYEVSNRKLIELLLRRYFGRKVEMDRYVKLHYVRQGEDVRYSIDDSALRSLGWKNKRHLEKELARIVSHYKNKVVW
jgi:dTDP-glucose 4,6-dehydratase